MIKNWKPLLDRLLVKQDEAPTKFPEGEKLGLVIPDDQRDNYRPHTGIIVSVGPGMYQNGTFCPVALKEQQHVMFAHPDTLTRVQHNGSEHLMMREQDVFLVLDAEATKRAQHEDKLFLGQEQWHMAERPETTIICPPQLVKTQGPLANDRYSTYNGLVARIVGKDGDKVTVLAENRELTHQLRVAIEHHIQKRIPFAFIGPKL